MGGVEVARHRGHGIGASLQLVMTTARSPHQVTIALWELQVMTAAPSTPAACSRRTPAGSSRTPAGPRTRAAAGRARARRCADRRRRRAARAQTSAGARSSGACADDARDVPRGVARGPRARPPRASGAHLALTRLCTRCDREAPVTSGGRLRAHKCAHKRACVLPWAQRRIGKRASDCAKCFEARQMTLPFAREAAE